MTYGSISKANVRYQLTVFFVLLGAFLTTLVLINIHPTVAIIVFWLGMLVLGLFAISEMVIRMAQRAVARRELQARHCPRCGTNVHRDEQEREGWHCDECGSTFLDSGFEQA
jgi:ribosomal protein S27AE